MKLIQFPGSLHTINTCYSYNIDSWMIDKIRWDLIAFLITNRKMIAPGMYITGNRI